MIKLNFVVVRKSRSKCERFSYFTFSLTLKKYEVNNLKINLKNGYGRNSGSRPSFLKVNFNSRFQGSMDYKVEGGYS